MSQSTITEKRTVISSSSTGGYESLDDIPYKANLGSRSSNILSRSSLPLRSSTGGGSIVRTVEYGYGSNMAGGIGPGGFSNISGTGVSSVKTNREREKRDLQDLNERFANYIEKVRFLEAQNRKLGSELDELRSKWGKETGHIKQMYEAELTEARRLIDDLSKDKAAFEIKLGSVQEQNADINRQLDEAKKYRQIDRETINKLNQHVADLESEINMLRRSMDSLETERQRDKTTINRLQQDLDKLRIDLNNETLAHLDAENRRQTLEEEMEFMKKVHEQELKELAALAYRDTTAENREFWKSELAQAIRDIQQEYDSKVDQLRGDMEGFYNLKIQEFRTGATKQNMEVTHVREENKKITKQMSDLRGKLADLEARNAQLEKQYNDVLRELETKDTDHMMECTQLREEISKLRTEMEGILTELQTLMDAKLSLELEICAYRKLLEGEENRVDWRSRASLIMYRDAFRPSSSYERSETQTKPAEKTEVVKEEPVVKKEEITESYEPVKSDSLKFEPCDASPDTDAASSITMSDHDSPKSEVLIDNIMECSIVEESIEKDVKSENEMPKSIEADEIETKSGAAETQIDTNANISKTDDEHVVAVRDEVKKIESRKSDDVDGSSSPTDAVKSVSPDASKSTEISPIKEQKSDLTAEPVTTNISDKTPSPIEEQIIPNQSSNIESVPEPTVVKTSPDVEETSPSLVSPSKSEPANEGKSESKDIICEGTVISETNKDSSPVKAEAISIVETENTKNIESKSSPLMESTPSSTENKKQQSLDSKIESTEEKSPSIDGEKNVEETKELEIKQVDDTKTKDTSIQEKEPSETIAEIVTEQLASPPAAEDKQDEKLSLEIKSLSPSKPTDTVASLTTDTKEKEAVSPKSPEKESMKDEHSKEKIVSPVVAEKETDKLETDKNEETTNEVINKKEVTEVVEKTEDKLLETVVTSKSIVQESKVSPAMVESSPTKELPDKPFTETSSKVAASESPAKSPVESDIAVAKIDEVKSTVDTEGSTQVDQKDVSVSKSTTPASSPGDASIEKSIPKVAASESPAKSPVESDIAVAKIDEVKSTVDTEGSTQVDQKDVSVSKSTTPASSPGDASIGKSIPKVAASESPAKSPVESDIAVAKIDEVKSTVDTEGSTQVDQKDVSVSKKSPTHALSPGDASIEKSISKDSVSESPAKSPVESDIAVAKIDEVKSTDDTDGPTQVDQVEVSETKSSTLALSPGDASIEKSISKDSVSESSAKSPVESHIAVAKIDEVKSADDTEGSTQVDQKDVSVSKSPTPALSPGDSSIGKSISNDSINEDKSAKEEKQGSPQTSPLGHPPEDPARIEEEVMTVVPTQSDIKDAQHVAEAQSKESSKDNLAEIKKDQIDSENVSETKTEPVSESVVIEESITAASAADTNQEPTKISNDQSETENKSLEDKSAVEKGQVVDSNTELEQSEKNVSESSDKLESNVDNSQTNTVTEHETVSKETAETQQESSEKTVDVVQIDNKEQKTVDSIIETSLKAEDSSKDTVECTKDSATSKPDTVETQSKEASESTGQVNETETKATEAKTTESSLESKEPSSNPESLELQATGSQETVTDSQETVVVDVSKSESKVNEISIKQSESSSVKAETISSKEEVIVKVESDKDEVKSSTSESISVVEESSAVKDEISVKKESKSEDVKIAAEIADSSSPTKEEDTLSEKSIKEESVKAVSETSESSNAPVESPSEVSELVGATKSEIKLPEGTPELSSGKVDPSSPKDEVDVIVDSDKHETVVSPVTHESSSNIVESSTATEQVSVKLESIKTEIISSPEKEDSKLDVDKSLVTQTNETEISESKSESKLSEAKLEVSLESSKTTKESSVVESVVHSKVDEIKTEITDIKSESKIEEKSESKTEIASSTILNGEHEIVQKSSTTVTTVNTDASQSDESVVQKTENKDSTTTENETHSEDTKINGVVEDPKATTDVETKRIEQTLLNGDVEIVPEENKPDSQISMKMMRGEVSAKTTYQRTSTGPIAISEVSPEGKFIMLENTSSGPNRRDVNLDAWKLKRSVDGKRDYTYNFRNFTLKAGKKVKILARGSASEAGLNDLVFRDEDNWGVGSQVTTSLINDKEEDKASHIQKTLYN